MKGRVGKRNANKTLNSVYELAKEAMKMVTPDEWKAAIRLAIRHEDMYAKEDQLDPSEEPDLDAFEEIANEEPEEKTVLKCDHCDYTTDSKSPWKRHQKSIKHCENCSKVFCGKYAAQSLKRHQKEHTYKPKNAHICIHCKKPFSCPSKLKYHMVMSKCGRL